MIKLLFSKVGRQVGLLLAAGLGLLIFAQALRWDAVRDDDIREEAARDAARVKHLNDGRERSREIETLDDDELLRRLNQRLRPGPR